MTISSMVGFVMKMIVAAFVLWGLVSVVLIGGYLGLMKVLGVL